MAGSLFLRVVDNLKTSQEVLTLKRNCNSLKMHVALWDKFAFLCNASVSSHTSQHVNVMQMS